MKVTEKDLKRIIREELQIIEMWPWSKKSDERSDAYSSTGYKLKEGYSPDPPYKWLGDEEGLTDSTPTSWSLPEDLKAPEQEREDFSNDEIAELIDIVDDKLAELNDLSMSYGKNAPDVHSRIAILEAIIVKLNASSNS